MWRGAPSADVTDVDERLQQRLLALYQRGFHARGRFKPIEAERKEALAWAESVAQGPTRRGYAALVKTQQLDVALAEVVDDIGASLDFRLLPPGVRQSRSPRHAARQLESLRRYQSALTDMRTSVSEASAREADSWKNATSLPAPGAISGEAARARAALYDRAVRAVSVQQQMLELLSSAAGSWELRIRERLLVFEDASDATRFDALRAELMDVMRDGDRAALARVRSALVTAMAADVSGTLRSQEREHAQQRAAEEFEARQRETERAREARARQREVRRRRAENDRAARNDEWERRRRQRAARRQERRRQSEETWNRAVSDADRVYRGL
jgi:hypothetical protein